MVQKGVISSSDNEPVISNLDIDPILDENTQRNPFQRDATTQYWKIMIADDEPEFHDLIKLVLRRFMFENKSLEFISAYSGREAMQLIESHPDTSLILLDMVMDKNDAGLSVARYVREQLKNRLVRIVLLTGQLRELPQESFILDYDINDYKTKAELTRHKLFNTIITALRSFRDLTALEANRKELRSLNLTLANRKIELERTNLQLRHEIAERKKLEALRFEQEQLRSENKLLEKRSQELARLNADKDKFFSIISHDLRGPFTNVLGFAKLIYEDRDSLEEDDLRMLSESLYTSAAVTYELLENLLSWARMQMGGVTYRSKPIKLNTLVNDSIRYLQGVASNKNIQIQNLIDADIVADADSRMLETILRNLISNAIKFTPDDGQVTISADRNPAFLEVQHSDISVPTEFIEVTVADTGVGISQDDIAKVLELGSYHVTYGTADEKGTGLGLIICKEMVEKHGGQIWIESKPGTGTTVKFTLPAAKSVPESA